MGFAQKRFERVFGVKKMIDTFEEPEKIFHYQEPTKIDSKIKIQKFEDCDKLLLEITSGDQTNSSLFRNERAFVNFVNNHLLQHKFIIK